MLILLPLGSWRRSGAMRCGSSSNWVCNPGAAPRGSSPLGTRSRQLPRDRDERLVLPPIVRVRLALGARADRAPRTCLDCSPFVQARLDEDVKASRGQEERSCHGHSGIARAQHSDELCGLWHGRRHLRMASTANPPQGTCATAIGPGWTSGGSHGNNSTVQSVIQPLCTQYGVDFVIGGHNHY